MTGNDLHEIADAASPWDAAENAKPLPKTYFGHVSMDSWFCVLEKGVGKRPFDQSADNVSQRRTAIDISIAPLPSSGASFIVERGVIAESRAWASIILPSIKALGISPREMDGKYAKYEMVRSGRTWEYNGETKYETVPKFLAVYETLGEAEDAAATLYGGGGDDERVNDTPIGVTGGNGNSQKETAEKFLPALWASSGHDLGEFQKLMASNPLVSQHFDINSPEVVALVGGAQ